MVLPEVVAFKPLVQPDLIVFEGRKRKARYSAQVDFVRSEAGGGIDEVIANDRYGTDKRESLLSWRLLSTMGSIWVNIWSRRSMSPLI